ncbi:hypothetical protein FQN53_004331 [Emmonsiellopsis sp. PD_33]|nr:hypothetical protein FQN53_004331 [Emmonsiellopsis sp. PD_33]
MGFPQKTGPDFRMMFGDLPAEMVLSIADQLDSQCDINSLSQINRRFNNILAPYLYRYNVRYCESSALYWAVSALNLETAKKALDGGADVNALRRTRFGLLNAFHLAVRSRQDFKRRSVKLKKKGESQGNYDKRVGNAPCKANDSMLTLLLERGADVNGLLMYSCERGSALAIAIHQSDPHLAQLLVANGVDVKAEGHDLLYLIMHHAVEKWDENLIRTLFEKGASVHSRDGIQRTPLHCAIKRRSKGVIRLLVESGADVEAREIYGRTPLHLAAESGQAGLIQQLIECGADMGAREPDGKTALHVAARSRSPEAIWLLIEYGADIESRDDKGCTPLHYAAWSNVREPVRVLLENGADVNARDNNGKSPIHYAFAFENAKLLVESGAEIDLNVYRAEALKKHAAEYHSRDIYEKPATKGRVSRRSTRLAKKQCINRKTA